MIKGVESMPLRIPARLLRLRRRSRFARRRSRRANAAIHGDRLPGLASGIAKATAIGSDTIDLSATDATGGVVPYSYQWQRSLDGGGTWSDLAGATTRSFSDTGLDLDSTYHYRLVFTDADADASTVTSNVVSATTNESFTFFVDEE